MTKVQCREPGCGGIYATTHSRRKGGFIYRDVVCKKCGRADKLKVQPEEVVKFLDDESSVLHNTLPQLA